MPKSATVYLQAKLARGLNLKLKHICSGAFPREIVNFAALRAMSGGGYIAVSHFDASEDNLRLIASEKQPFVCEVRDPRAATLSMLHHLVRYYRDPQLRPHMQIGFSWPDIDFYAKPEERQIDWMIEMYLPRVVEWLRVWVAKLNSDPMASAYGKLMTFDQLKADEGAFLKSLIAHFGIDEQKLDDVEVARDMSAHFRLGDDSEWKSVFTPAQADRATQMIPRVLRKQFGW
jgi:hypothetical protein